MNAVARPLQCLAAMLTSPTSSWLKASLSRAWSAGIVSVAIALTGCTATADESADSVSDEVRGVSEEKMVGGTVSTTAQDATVMLAQNGQQACTGTLIAPNLVLTARHCVAEPQGQADCATYGTQSQPSTISIMVGVNARANGTAAAKGSRIFVPTTSNMCSFDIALIQLDRDVVGAKIAPVRFTALGKNEASTAVGYGVDGQDKSLPQRMQRATSVLGVGPTPLKYTTKQNASVSYNIPQGDVATGESTCYGDSGGPLFDSKGAVIAVTSRGIPEFPQTGAHGNGCIDLPSIYAGVRFNEQTIRQAAQAAGHPLPATQPDPTNADEPADDEDSDKVDPQSDDDDESTDGEEEDEPAPKKKKSRRMMVQSGGACSAAPGRTAPGSTWLPVIGLAFAFAAARRRRA
ncbi:MAG: Trypsin-2 precursor [Labilithrix sp.]|nr:Trypsin-2 precursor [Labilithrix sp.]